VSWMQIAAVTIREIDDVGQMRAVEELQKEVWGIPDLDVVPLTHLVAAKEAGGVLIGAFDGEDLVGFVYGFPSFERGQLAHHSHMLAVKTAYRNLDLGRRLKLAQREHVIAQGIGLITWTFDPLQSLNAYFNFSKLGVVADRYLPNFYGEDAASFLHQTGTDRLWVSWLVSTEHVKKTISGINDQANLEHGLPLVSIEMDGSPRRNVLSQCLARDSVSIDIPGDINSLQRQTALRWREETRWAFTEAIEAGYVVVGFVREYTNGRYLLSKSC
jgi:predicted GNAT superfamily acetyltransferase